MSECKCHGQPAGDAPGPVEGLLVPPRMPEYEAAVSGYVADPRPEAWPLLAKFHRRFARSAVSAAEACAVAFSAMPRGLCCDASRDATAAIVFDLCQAYDASQAAERAAHARLTGAFAQKIRELDTLLDSLPAISFLKDKNLVYAGANQRLCTAVGLSRAEVIGRTDRELFPPELADRLEHHDRVAAASKSPIEFEEHFTIGGGERIVMFVRAPTLDHAGELSGLIGVGLDITERKRMEERLQLLAAALDAIAEGVVLTDADGKITWVNSGFEAVTGHAPTEAHGATLRMLMPPGAATELYGRMRAALDAEDTWKESFANERPRGGRYFCQHAVSPVRGPDGGVQGYVGVLADVSKEHRLAEKVHRAALIKSEFTAMVSHELRTPLTAITEAVDIVEDGSAGPLTEHQAEFLALAKRNISRLRRVINNTLDFAKLERGEFDLAPREGVDLLALLEEIQAQYEMSAKAAGVQLQRTNPPSLPPMTLDPDRLAQVLVNLIANAIRYAGPGVVRLTVDAHPAEVLIGVHDDGPGIPEDDRERIFSPYVQLSTGPGRAVGGTGLGLAISKRIVDLHGGRIWVDSAPGGGASFYFALPTRHRADGPDQRSHADSNIQKDPSLARR